MKNVLVKTILASSLVASSMLAEGLFVGGEAGYYKTSTSLIEDPGLPTEKKVTFKKSHASLGFKAGYDFDMYRVYGEYIHNFKAKINFEDGAYISQKSDDILIGADYTPKITDNFKFVVGAFGGRSKMKYKVKNDLNEIFKFSGHGWKIGAKVGGIYEINSQNEVEFGVKAAFAKYKSLDNKPKPYGAYIGYNYKF
ncbi:hypothetical protein CBLAS_0211 [Campylobacter blaseri]|uniref:Outer membrane protein beta-barrel domain-containing protein n=1 Tax=Campylobacter blaseri TaxID=2042961 RepID=A0A2P8R146_9BACT|nr:outer membrane beta-barrel protein [Campylobacter blaseri]PSM52218.1 hypothetical protein CQ405_03960 [Campylobacter blaseri]PSM53984.1 hypothetical protein CRN67_03960 [Campylobacter blaseri]QKF85421.1 hypothetical protein CBLAS_0211 [Campylobacter blaseri]